MIEKLEEDLEQMESLTTLIANDTAITRVPFAVGRLKNFGYISLCGYEGLSRDVVPSIILSWMSPTNNLPSPSLKDVSMSSLVPLIVASSSSHDPSSMFEQLPRLPCLWMKCDSKVDLFQCKTMILNALSATNSKGSDLVRSSGSNTSFTHRFVQIGMNCQVTQTLKQNILQGKGESHLSCLNFNSNGSSVKFEVPRVDRRILKTIVCAVYLATPDDITSDGLIKNVLVINYTKINAMILKTKALASFEDEDMQSAQSSLESGNEVEFFVVFENNFIVKNTTIYLIYDGPIHKELGFIMVP